MLEYESKRKEKIAGTTEISTEHLLRIRSSTQSCPSRSTRNSPTHRHPQTWKRVAFTAKELLVWVISQRKYGPMRGKMNKISFQVNSKMSWKAFLIPSSLRKSTWTLWASTNFHFHIDHNAVSNKGWRLKQNPSLFIATTTTTTIRSMAIKIQISAFAQGTWPVAAPHFAASNTPPAEALRPKAPAGWPAEGSRWQVIFIRRSS